jgi:hypothetical protein
MIKKCRSVFVLGAALAAITLSFTSLSGCEDDDDDAVVFGVADCGTVCDRYRACFDPAYDVGACTSRCQTAVNNDTVVSTDVDDCLECIGENTCAPTYVCADACDVVIVVQ